MVTRTSVGFCAKAEIYKLRSKKFKVNFISLITILFDLTKLKFFSREHKRLENRNPICFKIHFNILFLQT